MSRVGPLVTDGIGDRDAQPQPASALHRKITEPSRRRGLTPPPGGGLGGPSPDSDVPAEARTASGRPRIKKSDSGPGAFAARRRRAPTRRARIGAGRGAGTRAARREAAGTEKAARPRSAPLPGSRERLVSSRVLQRLGASPRPSPHTCAHVQARPARPPIGCAHTSWRARTRARATHTAPPPLHAGIDTGGVRLGVRFHRRRPAAAAARSPPCARPLEEWGWAGPNGPTAEPSRPGPVPARPSSRPRDRGCTPLSFDGEPRAQIGALGGDCPRKARIPASAQRSLPARCRWHAAARVRAPSWPAYPGAG